MALDQALPLPRPPGVKAASDPGEATTPSTTISLTAAVLAAEARVELAKAERMLPVVIAMVDRYAPNAPAAVKNEACVRFGSYLLTSRANNVTSRSAGPISADYVVNHAPAFRNSGAAALLTAWKVRRAGAIG